MAELILTDVDNAVLHQLQQRADRHASTPAEEAKRILSDVLGTERTDAWAEVDSIYERLAKSGRAFSDSADLLREDRDR
jgi:plasmid stability protein